MSIPSRLRRFAPSITAFALVCIGSLLVLPKNTETKASSEVTVLLANQDLPEGTPSAEVRAHVRARVIPVTASIKGAFSDIDEIPDGVLAAGLVQGQQLAPQLFASTRVAALGAGFVAISLRLDSQRWMGPVKVTGDKVDIYGVKAGATMVLASGATILDSPAVSGLAPRDDAIVTFGVPRQSVDAILVAAIEDRIWLVGT